MGQKDWPAEGKRRGRPGKSGLDKLRSVLWYQYVKSREGLTDYRLDLLFADEAREARGADRPRIFESIRKHQRIPVEQHKNRGFCLIDRVDQHPGYEGSARILRSPFWELCELPATSADRLGKILDSVITHLGLIHVRKIKEVWHWYEITRAEGVDPAAPSLFLSDEIPFEMVYTRAVGNRVNIDTLALTGALYRESVLGFNLEAATYYRSAFKAELAYFAEDSWMGYASAEFMDFAFSRIVDGDMSYEPFAKKASSTALEMERRGHGCIISRSDPLFGQFAGTYSHWRF